MSRRCSSRADAPASGQEARQWPNDSQSAQGLLLYLTLYVAMLATYIVTVSGPVMWRAFNGQLDWGTYVSVAIAAGLAVVVGLRAWRRFRPAA